ncbi:hypothetical protein C0992_006869 [Termitomyces sp. T32_za158]|nr:hypothetical protein C0992_006869 [Termitomyces sp. T32_za158]
MGGLAFRTGSGSAMSSRLRDKGPEMPLAMFERFLRDGGLASKIWKVREQSILTLVHIRRAHHQFPIRPYLSLLVDCLEDTDAHVRDCARQSVIELFTGPGVTDGARADLKKELTKKGVRKTIVEGVLSKLLGASANSNTHYHEGSEGGDASNMKPKEYIPPSLMLQGQRPTARGQTGVTRAVSQGSMKDIPRPSSRAATSPPLIGPTVPQTPTNESADIQPVYGKETEHNWAAREQAILRVRGMLKGDVHLRYLDTFLVLLKDGFIQWSLKTLASLRTTVSVNTSMLYNELAVALGFSFDPFCETLLTNLLKMAGFTKKITAQQSQASVTEIITHTSAQPRIVLPLLWNTLQEKTVQARTFVVDHVKQYVNVHGHRSKHAIEGTNGLELLEKSIKKALNDANPAVREKARISFWVFEDVWPEQGLIILESLDPNARKQVEKVCPKPELITNLPPTTPKVKKSLAATIAASRAKAKAIATAPPTLRHQATSGSHVPPVQRPASPATSPRSSVVRPSSPLTLSVSPTDSTTPARSRKVSGTMSRSVSSTGMPSSHSHSSSSGSNCSGTAASPPSPSDFRRRASSPLASSTASMSRPNAVRKALQSSPPSSRHVLPSTRDANNGTGGTAAVPIPARRSRLSLQMTEGDDESLLKAQFVPIPDSDSDEDQSVNLMSFSTPFEVYPPMTPQTRTVNNVSASPRSVDSKRTVVSNALSSGSGADMATDRPVVEDALRARAEQAESAAERLLELVDPEDESLHHSTLPPSLLVRGTNGHAAPKTKLKDKPASHPIPQNRPVPPATPINRNAAILRQAAMFQDSPVRKGQPSSLVDVLQGKRHETGWWLKRKACKLCFFYTEKISHHYEVVSQGTPPRAMQSTDKVKQLQSYITELADGKLDVHGLQMLALFSVENPVSDMNSPLSPSKGILGSPSPFSPSQSLPSLHVDLWEVDKNFERLFNALIQFLEPSKPVEEVEYGLIVLWELLENQGPYLEGRESDLFSVLLRVRYCNKLNVLEATSTIRDALTASIEPVYGITTMHASLRTFLAEPRPTTSDDDVKSASYAFGLIALGKFILRLPAEIAEEELPRLKGTLISSLNDKSSLIVRESAAVVIIAAQLVLRDETHLFVLLDGLADEKKNLLTYLFDKHGARGLVAATNSSSVDRLQKEISRLDTRTSTPFRPLLIAPTVPVTLP